MESVTPQVLTVGQLNAYLKSVIDSDYHIQNVFLCGEISNFTNNVRSGHFYLTLKDSASAVKAVMFRSYASRLKFMPKDGMKVLVFGSVSVYERSGQYQFYIENMQPDGLGSLNLAFEQRKERLSKEGLFDAERKKPIPRFPQKIGIVTSPTAAAFQDVCNVLRRRWPGAELILSPTQVQGDEAPAQIVKSIQVLDRTGVDVILVVRGGGSIEDLWAFNEEPVARAAAECRTPIISGVGHETDFTILDFVADLRAPTPSAAAELAAPDKYKEYERIRQMKSRMLTLEQNKIDRCRLKINALAEAGVMRSFPSLLNEKRLYVDRLSTEMDRRIHDQMMEEHRRLAVCAGKLDAYDPLKVIARGYGIVQDENNTLITRVGETRTGDRIKIRVQDGSIHCTVDNTVTEGAE